MLCFIVVYILYKYYAPYDQAAKVGINLIVLDDGWFGKRDNDTSSLGDWVADLSKFPHGIKGLAEDVNAAGCKFGIWFEPEMVSEDSVSATATVALMASTVLYIVKNTKVLT